jgi:hypothetical protein
MRAADRLDVQVGEVLLGLDDNWRTRDCIVPVSCAPWPSALRRTALHLAKLGSLRTLPYSTFRVTKVVSARIGVVGDSLEALRQPVLVLQPVI